MNKAALTIDPAVVGRYAAGGALTGAAVSSTLNLAHMIRNMRDERKKRLAKPETDEHTIVLTLPKRAEAVRDPTIVPVTVPAKNKKLVSLLTGNARDSLFKKESAAYPKTKLRSLMSSNARDLVVRGGPGGKQSRDQLSGRMGPQLTSKKAEGATGWPTLTASALAALGGGAAGAAVINKIYETQREKRLNAELAAAKQEYMDLLQGRSVKGASFIEELFPYCTEGVKEADSAFGLLNYPMAAMALLTILGSGGSAYLTKKILDEKLRENETKSLDIPKVNRIVLQSADTPGAKVASAEDVETVLGGLMVMLDTVGHQEKSIGHPRVKLAMEEAGLSKEALTGTGPEGNWDTVVGALQANPNLRKALYGLYTDYKVKSPVGRSIQHAALSIPGATRLADHKLYDTIAKIRAQVPPGGASSVKLGPKMAQDAVSMGASLLGSLMGKKVMGAKEPSTDELAKAIVEASEKAKQEEATKDLKVHDTVRVEANDPGAEQYLEGHQGAIKNVVKRLAAEGQI